jgi:gliding motility-associated-like protein
MKSFLIYILLTISILTASAGSLSFQPPLPPRLLNITVNHTSASATLWWEPGLSADVTGYVVYKYRNGEGYAIDTIRDPSVLTYTDYSTGALFFSESYVVASLDSENNVSPLSNALSTIFLTSVIDTCNLEIRLKWTGFSTPEAEVTAYEILLSTGDEFSLKATTAQGDTLLVIKGFDFYTTNRFVIRAVLSNGLTSSSNEVVVRTDLTRPPSWIGITDVSVNEEGKIEVNVKYDPLSEISMFLIERKSASDNIFRTVKSVSSNGGSFLFNDIEADITKPYTYRISAINSCNDPAIISAEAGNIVLIGEISDFLITLAWNSYKGWPEGPESYTIYYRTDDIFIERTTVTGFDTTATTDYRNIMYDLSGGSVCFFVAANSGAPGNSNAARSNRICFGSTENIFVPNAFSPDDNGTNDEWRPVMSFTPTSFHLIVRSRTGSIVYESTSHLQSWDGTARGAKLPPDVYLWYLKAGTPSGKTIERSGTLALIHNRYP